MRRLALLFFVIGATAADAEETACRISADHPLINVAHWYGLYYEDTKIGHAMTMMERNQANGLISHRFEMTFKLEQTEETIAQIRNFEAGPPHRLVDGRYQTADRTIDYQANGSALKLIENGSSRLWPNVERTLCDEEDIALHQFLDSSPAIGDEMMTVDFDVEHQALLQATHSLEAISTRKIMGADHLFHTLKTSSVNDVFSYTATSRYRNGEGINFFLGPIELRVETEAIARQPNAGVDLFAEFEKPLNRPLKELSSIDHLAFKVRVDDPAVKIDEVVGDDFLQRVDYLDDRTAIVTIGDFEAPLGDENIESFLKPTSAHPSDHPRLVALAEEVRAMASDPNDDRALAEALLYFVADYIENVPESPYAYNTTSVFDILDNRTGDCTEHSQLFITLARALGLPARDATGYVYSGDDQAPSLGGHAWIEAMIDGAWIGLDPTWAELDLNRSHIQTKNDFVMGLSFEVMEIGYRSQ
ncbi:MAG: transglutaminase-like domain-containing protein [Geminicoccales bacterium]